MVTSRAITSPRARACAPKVLSLRTAASDDAQRLNAYRDKLFFKMGEVATIVGVPAHVLRYWERAFPAIRPQRRTTKHRRYRKQDVELFLVIRRLLYDDGYTVAGARACLRTLRATQHATDSAAPAAEVVAGTGLTSAALRKARQLVADIIALVENDEPARP
jgi:DNA-binding transcriptional MerR regulator